MKFQVGDKVREIRGFSQPGVVIEAAKDECSSSGEWYLIDFGIIKGNQWSDGTSFETVYKNF